MVERSETHRHSPKPALGPAVVAGLSSTPSTRTVTPVLGAIACSFSFWRTNESSNGPKIRLAGEECKIGLETPFLCTLCIEARRFVDAHHVETSRPTRSTSQPQFGQKKPPPCSSGFGV